MNLNDIQECFIDWHKGCNGTQCLKDIKLGHEILENCGGYVP